jgi:diadenylate cyclase
MPTIFDSPELNSIIDFILICLGTVAFLIFVEFFNKRWFARISLVTFSVLGVVAYIFELKGFTLICFGLDLLVASISLFINMAEIRNLFANRFVKNNKITNKKVGEIEKIFDHDSLYKTINETTLYLSKHKIGAIITFERKDRLEDVIKNGSMIDAPVTYDLLITIFYPGTRLHDGAVVIRGNKIIAASVYYTPTTKPLIGKFGSRHRAAIGISEICDAVTVVVSEETGRISIAYNGEIESYSPDNFYKAFENIMSATDILSADSAVKGKEINE